MELTEAMRTTGAVREFTDDPLPDAVLHRILDSARFAPSGGNRQGVQIVVVRDPATRERLVELSGPPSRRYEAQSAIGETPWNSYAATAADLDALPEGTPAWVAEPLRRAPVVLVVCADLRALATTDKDLERVGIVGGASVYPLVWNLLLAARGEGFGGTITTMAVAAEPAVKELLGVPEPFAIAAVVPLGRPVKQVSRLKRAAVEEFTHLERWSGPPLGS